MAALLLHTVGADFFRKPEHALADDVLLDLRRAGIDRSGTRPQEGGRERARLTGRRRDFFRHLVGRARHQLAPRTQDLEPELEEALLELGVRELRDRRS